MIVTDFSYISGCRSASFVCACIAFASFGVNLALASGHLIRNHLCQFYILRKSPCFIQHVSFSWSIGQHTPVYTQEVCLHVWNNAGTTPTIAQIVCVNLYISTRSPHEALQALMKKECNTKLRHRKEMERQKVSLHRCYIISMSSTGPRGRK